jgi:hypothetical protein
MSTQQAKKTWLQNIMFCPQYFTGCPGEMWYARYTTIDSGWKFTKSAGLDFGDFAVYPNNGITIGATVGESGYRYNGPYYTNEDVYGYPGGLIMYTCSGTGIPSPEPELAHNRFLPGIRCGIGPGGSGGPWFTHNNGGVFVNGHNDHYTPFSEVISPYYDSEWYNNFNHAQEN